MSAQHSDTAYEQQSVNEPAHVRTSTAILLGFLALIATLGVWWIGYAAGLATFPPFDMADIAIHQSPGEFSTWMIANFQSNAQRLALVSGIAAWLTLGALLGLVLQRKPGRSTGIAVGLLAAPLAVILAYWSNAASGLGQGIWLTIWFGATLAAPLALAGHWAERLEIDARDRAQMAGDQDWLNQPTNRERREIIRNAIGGALALGLGGWTIGSLLRSTGAVDAQTGAGEPLDSVRASLQETPATEDETPSTTASDNEATPVTPSTPEPAMSGFDDDDDFDAPEGVRPVITSNEDFYTIDISTRDPVIQREQWTLKVGGLVDQEIEISYEDLLGMPSIELPGTLMCISFTYGSELIGTTQWTGVPLRDVLEMAGIGDGAVELILRGGGGYSDSIPIAKGLEETTLLAYGMNGETLPQGHGFPCRLYVPNIYGEKNVKWLEEIEVVDYEYTGFWQERGWDANNVNAVINILSVIDTPLGDVTTDESGTVPIGGIAFAGSRGIQSVEIQIDGGEWTETTLEPYDPELVWQRWKYDWSTEPGEHTLTVRAVDGEGNAQVTEEAAPFPDGMTGLQEVSVQVV